jgi:DNA polymerase II small subunit/DNA polymerase delta subunit B
MPIITPEEYPVLKDKGLIVIAKQPDGRLMVHIDRGETAFYTKAELVDWYTTQRQQHLDAIALLDLIKDDIEPL